MTGLTDAKQAAWAVGTVLPFISTHSLPAKCSQPRLSRCFCPCMILSAALRSHLGAANRDQATGAAWELLSQPAGSWTDCGKAALLRVSHINTTPLQSVTGWTPVLGVLLFLYSTFSMLLLCFQVCRTYNKFIAKTQKIYFRVNHVSEKSLTVTPRTHVKIFS